MRPVGSGVFLRRGGSMIEMEEAPYLAEADFQKLLEDHPNVLAGDQIDRQAPRRWLLIKREAGAASRSVSWRSASVSSGCWRLRAGGPVRAPYSGTARSGSGACPGTAPAPLGQAEQLLPAQHEAASRQH